ncbi:MAG: hypothetical protein U9N02_01355 [Campylobacterota bacterium]|nr:hypothetical protein [Campylobacterota bacterium]
MGYTNANKKFVPKYIGRSDSDLKARLLNHVSNEQYKEFKYSYATSQKAAFKKECQNFHDFGGSKKLDNDIHPDRPNGSGLECPICDIFD